MTTKSTSIRCRGFNFFTLLLGLLLPGPLPAVENHWTGTAGDHLWTNAVNWSQGVVPDGTQDVFVAGTGTNAVILNSWVEVASISLGGDAGSATLNIAGGQLDCYGPAAIATNAVLNLGGDFIGAWPLTVNGTVNWTAGQLSAGTVTISPSANLNLSGTGLKTLAAGVDNEGTVSCFATNLNAFPNFYFTNNNLFVLQSDFALSVSPGTFPWPEFHNNRIILLPAGSGQKTLTLGLNFFNQGVMEADTNAVLQIAATSSTAQFQDGTVFEGAGLLRFPANSSVAFDGNLTLSNTLEFAGSTMGGWPTWGGPGLLRWTGGGMNGFTFTPGFQVIVAGTNDITFGGNCTNLGTVQWQSSGRLLSAGYSGFVNLGQFEIESNCVLDTMSWPSGSFTNAGTVLCPANSGTVQLEIKGTPFINQGVMEADTNAVLEIISHDSYLGQFQNGTMFGGAGLLQFPANSSVTLDGNLTLSNRLEFAGNSLNGWPTWSGPGLVRWTGGGMSGFTLAPGFQMAVAGTNDVTFSGSCTNWGTIQWQSSGRLLSAGYSGFVNLGWFVIETNCVFDTMSWPSGSFTNAATVSCPANTAAQLEVNGTPFINQGTIETDLGATLQIVSHDFYLGQFQDGTVFNGAGLLQFPANSSVTFDGNLTLSNTLEFAGNSLNGWPTWSGPGLLRWTGGGMNGFTFGPGFQVEMTGPDTKYISGACTNLGTICWTGDSPVSTGGSATFNNGGLFLARTNGNWTAAPAFNNLPGGIFRQTGGLFSLGTLDNSGTLKLEKGILNSSSLASVGSGSYQSSLSGYTPGAGFNQVQAQNFGLDGSLTVTLTNGFAPTNGSSFVIATGGNRTGKFAGVTLPPAQSNLVWRVRYTPTDVILQLSSPLAAGGSTRLEDGRFQFILSGPAASAYVIQASTNMTDWLLIETNSPFTGNLIFTDPDADQFPHRYYRCQIFD